MKTASFKTLALGGALALLSGCVGGQALVNNSSVKIRTSPEGALATSEYGDSCTTPCSLRLRTSKGGAIRLSKAGFEDEIVTIGTHFDDAGVAGEAVRIAATPDPWGLAVEGLFSVLDPKGQGRKLNTRHIDIALLPIGSTRPPPREAPLASASIAAPAGGGEVRRLSQEQVEAIVGPPLRTEMRTFTANPSPRRSQ